MLNQVVPPNGNRIVPPGIDLITNRGSITGRSGPNAGHRRHRQSNMNQSVRTVLNNNTNNNNRNRSSIRSSSSSNGEHCGPSSSSTVSNVYSCTSLHLNGQYIFNIGKNVIQPNSNSIWSVYSCIEIMFGTNKWSNVP